MAGAPTSIKTKDSNTAATGSFVLLFLYILCSTVAVVTRTPWQRLLEMRRSQPLRVGWVKDHVRSGTLTTKLNQRADYLAPIRVLHYPRGIVYKKSGDGYLNGCTLSEVTPEKWIFIMSASPSGSQCLRKYMK